MGNHERLGSSRSGIRNGLRFVAVALLLAGAIVACMGVAIFMGGKTEAQPVPLTISLVLAFVLPLLTLRLWRRCSPPKSRERAAMVGIVMFVAFVGTAIVFPVFAGARAASTHSTCISNLKQLHVGMLIYAGDHNDRLAPAHKWLDLTRPFLRAPDARCPLAQSPFSYAMNATLGSCSLADIADSDRTVLIFEAESASGNPHGGKERLARRHGGNSFAVAVTGQITRLRPENEAEHVWSPLR